jgi:hypothetical protein
MVVHKRETGDIQSNNGRISPEVMAIITRGCPICACPSCGINKIGIVGAEGIVKLSNITFLSVADGQQQRNHHKTP